MRLRSRRLLTVVLVLLGLAALPFLYYWHQGRRAGQELSELLAELDRTEAPWRLDDLVKLQPFVPDERNSALVIKNARLPMPYKLMPVIDDFKLTANESLPPEHAAKLAEFLEHYADNLKEARRLMDFPEGRFFVTIRPDVISTAVPHVDELRGIGTLLRHDVWWQAQQANFEQAAQSSQAMLLALRGLRHDVFLIGHLVRLAVLREAATSLERLLAQGEPAPELLTPLIKLLLEDADFDGWTPAVRGERAGMHQFFEFMKTTPTDLRYLRGLAGARQRNSWYDAVRDRFATISTSQAHAFLLRHVAAVLATSKLPVEERLARLRELEDLTDAPELAVVLIGPRYTNCLPVFLRTEAKLRCTAAGLAAEQYRRAHGRWPRTVDELAPKFMQATPLDPYSAKPLAIRANNDGIVIYSRGPDGTFDGDRHIIDSTDPQIRPDHEHRLWDVNQRRRGP